MSSHDEEDDFKFELSQTESRIFNGHLLKAEHEFFHEEAHICHPVVNVKRFSSKKRGEIWEIWVDQELALTLKAERFTAKEKKFFQTVEGMKFLIAEYKAGAQSVVKLKQRLKEVLP